MEEVKKKLYTLCVDGYEPEITKLTFPLLQLYANKIGAEFVVINERKWPELPPVVEKFQVWEMALSTHKADWHIFFDADTLIHPDMWDVTAVLGKDTTCSGITSDFTPMRFKPDEYFLRDGRFIGKGNWCAIFSEWCLDYFIPPWMSTPYALSDSQLGYIAELATNINLTVAEAASGVMQPSHLIDDYIVSRNIARYGLKHTLISEVGARYGQQVAPYLWHQYLHDTDEKVVKMKQVLQGWGVQIATATVTAEVVA